MEAALAHFQDEDLMRRIGRKMGADTAQQGANNPPPSFAPPACVPAPVPAPAPAPAPPFAPVVHGRPPQGDGVPIDLPRWFAGQSQAQRWPVPAGPLRAGPLPRMVCSVTLADPGLEDCPLIGCSE